MHLRVQGGEVIELTECVLCGEEIAEGDELAAGTWIHEGRYCKAHRECALRNVIGGIGHLRDHYFWCKKMGDPDGGMSYRQSAIEVDAWVVQHGIHSGADPADA
jgi:hypothetical protein